MHINTVSQEQEEKNVCQFIHTPPCRGKGQAGYHWHKSADKHPTNSPVYSVHGHLAGA